MDGEPTVEKIKEPCVDGEWRLWRHLDTYWEAFESKGWQIARTKSVPLPPVFAESGSYRISFCYWNREQDESLFELRESRGKDQHRVALVWGIPTPCEAEELLATFGVAASEARSVPQHPRDHLPVVHAPAP